MQFYNRYNIDYGNQDNKTVHLVFFLKNHGLLLGY